MTDPNAIQEIEERLIDFAAALRESGCEDIARGLEEQALDFTDPARVRPAVNQIRQRLEHWRVQPEELPETAKVQYTANLLEDACRSAMGAGVIAAARPSIASQARRKVGIVLATLLVGAFLLLIPIVLVEAGLDFTEMGDERVVGPVKLPQGEEASVEAWVLSKPELPDAVRDVVFSLPGDCRAAAQEGELSCEKAPERLWPGGRLPTFELKLPHQAYGLVLSIARQELGLGRVGEARVLLAATDDTPEGRYTIALSAAYLGYTPLACNAFQRLQKACPRPRVGKKERHRGLAVPKIIVDVVRGDPAKRLGEKRLAAAEAEEARRKAEKRAAEIAAVLSEIDGAMAETDELIRKKRWEPARDRLQQLSGLFEPLQAIGIDEVEAGIVPREVEEVRERFDAQRAAFAAFEDKLFDATFEMLTAEKNERVEEERLLGRLGKKFRVSPEYVKELYLSRTDEMQRRLDARAQAHMDKLKAEQQAREARCGPLPTEAWGLVERYLKNQNAGVEIELGECLTPRLTDDDCWEVRCDYTRRVEISVERPKVVTRHRSHFYLVRGRVARQR